MRTSTATGMSFVDRLAERGPTVALVDRDGTPTTYAELDARADDAVGRLGAGRRLVQVVGANDVDTFSTYLGALRAGHVVLLTGPDHAEALASVHRPDVVVAAGELVERRAATAHALHPELALLLSTSGSTGSPKLVRLSRANLDANARAIGSYLGLGPEDRAITTLPMHYCYGLSVLHSHLVAGSAVVCTDTSVVDPCFWDAVRAHDVTTLAGVPHTFELMARAGQPDPWPDRLRLVTQAGGRMDPGLVERVAARARAAGAELFVMYGQTEATARMAYLPPHLAGVRPGAVGIAVPGGSFRIDPFEGSAPGEGEIVYRGPNVMMGYAEGPDDLARGRELTELRTGDIGRLADDGLLEVVGRRRGFVKPFGLRIDLDALERLLARHGTSACVVGDDDGVGAAVLDGTDPARVADLLRTHTSLPGGAVLATALDDVPRLTSGKVDRAATLALVRTAAPAGGPPVAARGGASGIVAGVLGVPHAGPDDTFVSLGGDSLSYVEASVRLEEHLGHLPEGWHLLPLRDLDQAATTRRRCARVETTVVLRAIAITLIVANHTGAFLVGGGAHVLFAAAGANFARFQLTAGSWWRSTLRLAVPAVVWIGGVAALTDDFDLAHAALVHGWLGGRGRWAYWFVEVLVQVLVVLAVLLAIPAVRRFERRRPFAFPGLLLAASLLVRFDLVDAGDHHRPFFRPHEIVWMFLLGWMATQADTRRRRVAVTAVALAAVPGFFGDPRRDAVLLVGMLALVWVPSLPVPRPLHRAVGAVAGASLYIYLTHVQVHPLVSGRWPWAGLALSLLVGLAVHRAADPLVRAIGRQTPSPWRPAPDAKRAAPSRVSPERTGTSPSRVSLARAASSGSPHCS